MGPGNIGDSQGETVDSVIMKLTPMAIHENDRNALSQLADAYAAAGEVDEARVMLDIASKGHRLTSDILRAT